MQGRTPLIAGNWKMFKTGTEAAETARALVDLVRDVEDVDVMIAPAYTALSPVAAVVKNSPVALGAQNLHWEKEGAYTGEISAGMLAAAGCRYVIIGHSERRQYFGETDEGVNQKAKAALAHDLTPIICVGENLDQKQSGQTAEIVGGQVRGAFDGIGSSDAGHIVVAYEPIWAIGTGMAAVPAEVNQIIGTSIRGVLADLYGQATAQAIRVQYGGSVKADNMADFAQQAEIDGALVGGASLKADSFAGIIQATL